MGNALNSSLQKDTLPSNNKHHFVPD